MQSIVWTQATSYRSSRTSKTKDDNDQEVEVALVEKAYFYITKKTYPASCTKNDKKLVVKDGVLYFKKDRSEVWFLYSMCTASYEVILRVTVSSWCSSVN